MTGESEASCSRSRFTVAAFAEGSSPRNAARSFGATEPNNSTPRTSLIPYSPNTRGKSSNNNSFRATSAASSGASFSFSAIDSGSA